MPEQGYRYDPTEQRGVKRRRLNRGERAWGAANELDDKYIYMHRILSFRIGNCLIDWKCYFSCQMLPTHMTFEGLLGPVVGQPHPYPPSVQRLKKKKSSALLSKSRTLTRWTTQVHCLQGLRFTFTYPRRLFSKEIRLTSCMVIRKGTNSLCIIVENKNQAFSWHQTPLVWASFISVQVSYS